MKRKSKRAILDFLVLLVIVWISRIISAYFFDNSLLSVVLVAAVVAVLFTPVKLKIDNWADSE